MTLLKKIIDTLVLLLLIKSHTKKLFRLTFTYFFICTNCNCLNNKTMQ